MGTRTSWPACWRTRQGWTRRPSPASHRPSRTTSVRNPSQAVVVTLPGSAQSSCCPSLSTPCGLETCLFVLTGRTFYIFVCHHISHFVGLTTDRVGGHSV